MKYELTGNNILFALNRTEIIDIVPDDVIVLRDFPGAQYTWTAHDGEFLENNPDDDIYLQVERMDNNRYRATGIHLKSAVADGSNSKT